MLDNRHSDDLSQQGDKMPTVPDDLFSILIRFHREVIAPDVKRTLGEAIDALAGRMNARFDDLNNHFDSIYQRFHRLETEYHMLVAGLKRVEGRRP